MKMFNKKEIKALKEDYEMLANNNEVNYKVLLALLKYFGLGLRTETKYIFNPRVDACVNTEVYVVYKKSKEELKKDKEEEQRRLLIFEKMNELKELKKGR
jgi:hypothetical protein